MKVRILSDLHLEFTGYRMQLPSIGEDLVVLAGDIGVGMAGIEWAKREILDRPVIYILGNHEFYKHDWDEMIESARSAAAGSNVHFLEDEAVTIGGIRILGATLWTDFLAMGQITRRVAADEAQQTMSDFRMIRRAHRTAKIFPQDMIRRCERSRDWLDREISGTEPILVVTHHAPTMATVSPQYALALSNAAFHNGFDYLIRPPVAAWVHGHTHHSCIVTVNGVPVVSNQLGYPGEECGFRTDLVIEI